MQFRKYMKSGFPYYGKSAGKQKHFKCMGFLNILGEAVIHIIPLTQET